ncbi:MAG TPA: hypothetical protein GX708_01715 [Gallicola sp.]|nr:hypothetical protein [Gallicola sp.]
MIKSRILIPRKNIQEFLEPLDERGGAFVILDNGMTTDVYLDDLNNYRSITNNRDIIIYLEFYGLELYTDNVNLREIQFYRDEDETYNIRFEIKIKGDENHYKVKLSIDLEEGFSLNEFLIFSDNKVSLENFKEVNDLISYFLYDILGVTKSIFTVVTRETKRIENLLNVGYENKKGFINAYDNPKVGEYMLEKDLPDKK